MSVAKLLLPFVPVNPVVYTRLAAIDRNFYTVFTQNKLWVNFNVYDLPGNEDGNSIFKHFIATMLSSNQLGASFMHFVWDPEHWPGQLPPSPPQDQNLYALLGQWQPKYHHLYCSLEYPRFRVSKRFVLCAVRLNGIAPFAFELGMPLALYEDADVIDAAIEYCGCNFKLFKSLRGDYYAIEKALVRGCRRQRGCHENPFLFVEWSKLPVKLRELAIKTGLVSVFEVPVSRELWRVYLEYQWKFKTKSPIHNVEFDCIDHGDYIFRIPSKTFRMDLGPQPVRVRVARDDQVTLEKLAQIAFCSDWRSIESTMDAMKESPVLRLWAKPPLSGISALPEHGEDPTLNIWTDSVSFIDAIPPSERAAVQKAHIFKDSSLDFSFLKGSLLFCLPVALLVIYWKLHFNIYIPIIGP